VLLAAAEDYSGVANKLLLLDVRIKLWADMRIHEQLLSECVASAWCHAMEDALGHYATWLLQPSMVRCTLIRFAECWFASLKNAGHNACY
jgi:hypothetical protein